MQHTPDVRGDGHEVDLAGRSNVHGCDNFRFRELPDVQLVHGQDTLDIQNIIAHLVERDLGRNALEQDEGCAADCGWSAR